MMRKLLITLGVCVAVTVGSSAAAVAGFDEGFAAYERGDFATARKEFRVLADQFSAQGLSLPYLGSYRQ